MAGSDDRDLQIEARLLALEYLFKHILWNMIIERVDRDGGDDQEAVQTALLFAENAIDELNLATFRGGLDPALSDHLAACVRDHVERVVQELVAEMKTELGGDRSS